MDVPGLIATVVTIGVIVGRGVTVGGGTVGALVGGDVTAAGGFVGLGVVAVVGAGLHVPPQTLYPNGQLSEQFLLPPPIRTQSDPGGNVGLGVMGGVTDPFVVATMGAVVGFGLHDPHADPYSQSLHNNPHH